MEGTVKEELCEVFNSFNTEQQDPQPTRHGRKMSVHKSKQLSTIEDDRIDDVDQDKIFCRICCKSFSSKVFNNHVNMEHNVICTTGGSEWSTDKQTHINYYDAFQTIKMEVEENEDNAEIKEEIFPFELSNVVDSFSEDVNYNTVHLEACSQIKKEEIGDDVPVVIKVETIENLNKGYKDKIELLVKSPSETKYDLSNSGKISFACNICEYKCSQKSHLNKHIKTHIGEKPYACNICDYRCSYKSKLREHIRTHTGEKPFSCDICDYKCSRKSSLSVHMRTHTGEKPFSCNICGYKYSQKSRLREHIRSHTGEKPFSCNICDHKFSERRHLSQHSKIHTGVKPFACIICDYKCSSKSNLNIHIRTHTGEKAFACNICDYKCDRKTHLQQHIRKHTGEKPYACNVCDYKSSQKCSLRRHLQTHMG